MVCLYSPSTLLRTPVTLSRLDQWAVWSLRWTENSLCHYSKLNPNLPLRIPSPVVWFDLSHLLYISLIVYLHFPPYLVTQTLEEQILSFPQWCGWNIRCSGLWRCLTECLVPDTSRRRFGRPCNPTLTRNVGKKYGASHPGRTDPSLGQQWNLSFGNWCSISFIW